MPWRGISYRVARVGVRAVLKAQIASITATFNRIFENSTYEFLACDGVARFMEELVMGVRVPKGVVRRALRGLACSKSPNVREKYQRNIQLITMLYDGSLWKGM